MLTILSSKGHSRKASVGELVIPGRAGGLPTKSQLRCLPAARHAIDVSQFDDVNCEYPKVDEVPQQGIDMIVFSKARLAWLLVVVTIDPGHRLTDLGPIYSVKRLSWHAL